MSKQIKSHFAKLAVPLILALALGSPARALEINIIDVTVGGASAESLAAFNEAAALWESVFTDDVTVNIAFDFAALPPGVLGGTGSISEGYFVSDVVAALGADATSAADALAVANLPGGPSISFRTNDIVGGAVFLDNNDTTNNFVLDVNRANAKALGLLAADDAGFDADITFSNSFGFDFDPSDGIDAGLFDFVGVAAHELGHALGFVSGVDLVDFCIDFCQGEFGIDSLDDFRVFSVWDLFRYSSESLAMGDGVFDFAVGPHADLPYFSLDGGLTNLAAFETGRFEGTGRQASHWRDNLGIGIMDPTFSAGELGQISLMDLLAFDAMGWDLNLQQVPEPGTLALLGLGLLGMGALRRRRNRH